MDIKTLFKWSGEHITHFVTRRSFEGKNVSRFSIARGVLWQNYLLGNIWPITKKGWSATQLLAGYAATGNISLLGNTLLGPSMGRKDNGKGPKTSPEWNNDDSKDGDFSCSVGWVQQGKIPYRAKVPLYCWVWKAGELNHCLLQSLTNKDCKGGMAKRET